MPDQIEVRVIAWKQDDENVDADLQIFIGNSRWEGGVTLAHRPGKIGQLTESDEWIECWADSEIQAAIRASCGVPLDGRTGEARVNTPLVDLIIAAVERARSVDLALRRRSALEEADDLLLGLDLVTASMCMQGIRAARFFERLAGDASRTEDTESPSILDAPIAELVTLASEEINTLAHRLKRCSGPIAERVLVLARDYLGMER